MPIDNELPACILKVTTVTYASRLYLINSTPVQFFDYVICVTLMLDNVCSRDSILWLSISNPIESFDLLETS